jgi:hypothetical protein
MGDFDPKSFVTTNRESVWTNPRKRFQKSPVLFKLRRLQVALYHGRV